MPDVRGRIIERWLGKICSSAELCRSEGDGLVEFDMIALKSGNDLVRIPSDRKQLGRRVLSGSGEG